MPYSDPSDRPRRDVLAAALTGPHQPMVSYVAVSAAGNLH